MDKDSKTYDYILLKKGDSNIPFDSLRSLLFRLGFSERIKGGHHIFSQEGIPEILNLQPKGGKAKSYQVRQVRNLILRRNLELRDS
jgi:hypothetical protein